MFPSLSSIATPSLFLAATQFTPIRCQVKSSRNSAHSPLNSSNFSESLPNSGALLFSGCDYDHRLIVMPKLGREDATKQQP